MCTQKLAEPSIYACALPWDGLLPLPAPLFRACKSPSREPVPLVSQEALVILYSDTAQSKGGCLRQLSLRLWLQQLDARRRLYALRRLRSYLQIWIFWGWALPGGSTAGEEKS